MHTPRTSRQPPPRPACVPALPDLSTLLPKARPALVHPNPLPLPGGRHHPVDPRPRSTQLDVQYAIGRGRVPIVPPASQPAVEPVQGIKCSVPVWPHSAASGRGSTERTSSHRSIRTSGRLATKRTTRTPSTASASSSRIPNPHSTSSSKAAEAAVSSSTPPRTAVRPAVVPCPSYPACLPAAGNVPPRSRTTDSHSFRSPPRSAAANPQRLDCSPAFRGLTPRKSVGLEHAADVAWLDIGVKGKGWGVEEKTLSANCKEEKREQESFDVHVERKRTTAPTRTPLRSTPAAATNTVAQFTSAIGTTSALPNTPLNPRPAMLASSGELRPTTPSVEPAAFLSLIKTDPTRAFQLIFPDYDIDDNKPHNNTTAHTVSRTRSRHVVEENERAAYMRAQPVSPQPLSPFSPGWKYQQTAAFDVQRPDTAGERKQRTHEVKEQVVDDSEQQQSEQDSEEEEEIEQPANAWTRDAVQRIVSHATQSWNEPTTPQYDEEEKEEEEQEADETNVERSQHSNSDEPHTTSYSEDEIEEEHWPTDDEQKDEQDDNNTQPNNIEAVTVSPPSPPHASVRTPPVFDRKRPSPVSTHFLRPEQSAASDIAVSALQSASSDHSSSPASVMDESPSSQQSTSSFTIAPSAPVSPAASTSEHDSHANGSDRRRRKEVNDENLFEL